jgi:hypothetical protein
MKLYRVILVCTLLLLAVAPTYAIPTCTECLEEGVGPCINAPGQPYRCRFTSNGCETLLTSFCEGRSETPVLADWKIASIEISRPAPATRDLQKVVTTPSSIAQAGTPQLPVMK